MPGRSATGEASSSSARSAYRNLGCTAGQGGGAQRGRAPAGSPASPELTVKAQEYPHILVTAGLNDPCVMYSEPAKFVAKLRELKRDDNLLLFKCEVGAGHNSKSGRFEKLREDAFSYTFLLKALGMTNTA
ncbi:protease 2 [Triticum aestivum]|nr:protease 2-like [Triticum aestivum]